MTVAFAGVTAIETMLAAVTVIGAVPIRPSRVATIVVKPAACAVATPLLTIDAAAGVMEDQTTLPEILPVEPSEYAPDAVYVTVPPAATVVEGGLTVIDVNSTESGPLLHALSKQTSAMTQA